MELGYIKLCIAFTYYIRIRGDSGGDDHEATDGQRYMQKLIKGDNAPESPEYLLFTAPFGLCKGGCDNSSNNFVMAFPLFLGNKGKGVYKKLYPNDYATHKGKDNAPFHTFVPGIPFTTCSSEIPNSESSENTTTVSTKEETSNTASTRFNSTLSTAPVTTGPSEPGRNVPLRCSDASKCKPLVALRDGKWPFKIPIPMRKTIKYTDSYLANPHPRRNGPLRRHYPAGSAKNNYNRGNFI